MSDLHPVSRGEVLWRPSEEVLRRTNLRRYMNWLETTRGLAFADYRELWSWSVTDLEGFWQSIWDYFAVRATRPAVRVLSGREMPGARWFEGAELNYAEHALRRRGDADAV